MYVKHIPARLSRPRWITISAGCIFINEMLLFLQKFDVEYIMTICVLVLYSVSVLESVENMFYPHSCRWLKLGGDLGGENYGVAKNGD